MPEYNLDAETLRQMYHEEGMTVAAIARALRVRKQTVCAAFNQWDIPRRRRGPRRQIPAIPFTVGEVRRLVERKGIGIVAQDLGVVPDAINGYLGREPQPRGTKRVVDDVAVWTAYTEGMPIAEMTVKFQCSYDTLRRSLRRSFFRAVAGDRGNQ